MSDASGGGSMAKRSQSFWMSDHHPACPSCGDLCGRLARKCASCGRPLYPSDLDLDAAERVGSGAMRRDRLAAQLREDAEARKGTEA